MFYEMAAQVDAGAQQFQFNQQQPQEQTGFQFWRNYFFSNSFCEMRTFFLQDRSSVYLCKCEDDKHPFEISRKINNFNFNWLSSIM